MNRLFPIIGLTAAMALGGCASIVDGTTQTMSIQTYNNGNQVTKATCSLINSKGTWFIPSTPGTTTVHKDYGDMTVTCKKSGMNPGIATVQSHAHAMWAGNIVFGGVVGAGVDAADGAAYNYPNLVTVLMGKHITVAPPKSKKSKHSKTASAAAN